MHDVSGLEKQLPFFSEVKLIGSFFQFVRDQSIVRVYMIFKTNMCIYMYYLV
jgi:hypothetical protein